MVAEGVTQSAVDAVGSLGRLLGKLHPFRPKLVVRLAAVGRREEEVSAGRAFRHQLAGLLGGLHVHTGWARLLQQDLARVDGHVDRHPAYEATFPTGYDLATRLA